MNTKKLEPGEYELDLLFDGWIKRNKLKLNKIYMDTLLFGETQMHLIWNEQEKRVEIVETSPKSS